MSAKMSGYSEVRLWGGDYLFLLLDWSDFASERKAEVMKNLDAFGARLGPKAWVVSIFDGMNFQAAEELLAKPWPTSFREKLEGSADPALLIIDKGFDEFDPGVNDWVTIWFSDHQPESIYRLLNELATHVHEGDLFSYARKLEAKGRGRRILEHVEAKPGVFGFSIDAKAIMRDLLLSSP